MAPTTLVQPEEEEQQSSQTDEPSFGPATEVFESPRSQGTDEEAAADGGVDGAAARRARRVSKAINYKEPSLTKFVRLSITSSFYEQCLTPLLSHEQKDA